ncbi:trans-sulfuration enzyme family protein [Gracilimonas mengyeensis]|uniref:O-succinylhomoserine sulfhydrylase n=1 Tax=Gracilimonas mengyeensis TaxID=1302730 RepID=A0A521C2T5_9BACT|nr:aminotransferase class I/II-fold pyridoxal phosphate-dependent enzyme [Gracilimonas mengyeensis]SMO53708.1 O-succinylhomoserine sulfhydrylase [Gracilimonas mengyeensis]
MKRKATQAIRTQTERSKFGEHASPIYMTSSYVFENAEHMRAMFAGEEDGNVYSRYSNPTVDEFIDKICLLENAEAGWATASGMAAVFTTFAALLDAGDEVLSSRSVFGSTHKLFTQIFPKWNIHTNYVSVNDFDEWEEAITPNTKILYLETPSNPALDIVDLEKAGELAKKHDLIYVVDNCFTTPIIQNPIDFGADLVIHSATKYIDGQGRGLGGAMAGKQELIDEIEAFARHSGPCLSPFNAWMLSKSLETLELRMERHSSSALEIAKRLQEHPSAEWVKYPFLETHPGYETAQKQMTMGGGIVTFGIKGGLDAGRNFLDALEMLSLTANLGDSRTIATHPASTTHSKLSEEERQKVGITQGLIRLSIGLEDVEDIWEDIEQALG